MAPGSLINAHFAALVRKKTQIASSYINMG